MFEKKGVEQLMSAICKSQGLKQGTQNPGINFPIQSQEIIAGACLALKHQCQCGDKYNPSFVTVYALEVLWLQQEIKEVHDKKVAFNNWPTLHAKNYAARPDLIEQHFWQIWGIDEAPCA